VSLRGAVKPWAMRVNSQGAWATSLQPVGALALHQGQDLGDAAHRDLPSPVGLHVDVRWSVPTASRAVA